MSSSTATSEVCDLIDRCAAGETEGWSSLFFILKRSNAIETAVRAHGLDEGLADDIRQELFFHLQERSAYRLRSFRGTTEAQFRVFLRRVAMRFTHRCLTRWWRNQWREDHAVRLLARQGRRGPTESELLGFLQELEALMTDCDRARLRMVLRWAGLTDPDRPIAGRCDEYSDRTYRRWSADLYLRYARRVI